MSAMAASLPGASVVDLFAGSGALGLEALSRGAERVVFVERARGALRCLEENIALLSAREACKVVRGDALAYASRLEPGAFDIALADPPYDRGLARALVERFREVPFARELWVEHRTTEDVPHAPGLRHRRYGDTTLTTVLAGP
jgi:16S rRNA (guanine966-N2)-methyltransferase